MKNYLILVVITFTGCSSSDKNAPERNFYYEIKNRDSSSFKLSEYLRNHISNHKYTITNHSGLDWPFYKELQTDEAIPKDSLMPPHWYVHRMVFKKPDQQIGFNEFLVQIDLSPKPDTLPNYSVEIFRMDSTGLTLSARTGLHYIDSSEFTTRESLNEVYLKSIIRYSFK